MQINKNNEILIASLFIVFLFLCLNPFGWFMYTMWEMLILVLLVVIFAVFTVFVWNEGKGDERENMHRMLAGRYAFLAGTTTLIAGIVVQSLEHDLDHWLVITLGVMVLAKIFGLLYGQKKY